MSFDQRSKERYEFSDYKVEYTLGDPSDDEMFEADLINANGSDYVYCRRTASLLDKR